MEQALGRSIGADLAALKEAAQDGAARATILPASALHQGSAGTAGFSQALHHAVAGVDAKDREAADKMAAVDSGSSDDLVGAMLASQDASLSFSMLMQVRNKVMGAVEDLVKLPL